jgi:hypothetical protein
VLFRSVYGGAIPGLSDVDFCGEPEKTAFDFAQTQGHNQLANLLLSEPFDLTKKHAMFHSK